MSDFEDGVKWFQIHNKLPQGNFITEQYITEYRKQIEEILSHFSLKGKKMANKTSATLQGDLAEFYVADTFNLSAIVNHSNYRARTPRSNKLGSPDIEIFKVNKFGKEIPGSAQSASLKYYKKGASAAKAQLLKLEDTYRQYLKTNRIGRTAGNYSFKDYLENKRIDTTTDNLAEYLYGNQIRIVAKGKLTSVRTEVDKMISLTTDPKEILSLKELKNLLTDLLRSPDGTAESTPITRGQSEHLARLAKKNRINLDNLGIDVHQLFSWQKVLEAGKYAAILTFVCEVAPMIIGSIIELFERGEMSFDSFTDLSLSDTASSFLQGVITSALSQEASIHYLKGLDSEGGVLLNTETLAIIVSLVWTTVSICLKGYRSQKSCGEIASELILETNRLMLAFAGMRAGAYLGLQLGKTSFLSGNPGMAAIITTLTTLLGSLIGAVIGGVTNGIVTEKMISFCMESGSTMFGIVEQDYTIPEECLKLLPIQPLTRQEISRTPLTSQQVTQTSIRQTPLSRNSLLPFFLERRPVSLNKIIYVCRNY